MADDSMNGRMYPPPMRLAETARFRIGGVDYDVPALALYDLEHSRASIAALSPELDTITYARHVIDIISGLLAPDDPEAELAMQKSLMKVCSFPESKGLVTSMNDLLRVSGFDMGEAEPPEGANPGTGTSIDSLQNSEAEGFVEGTPTA